MLKNILGTEQLQELTEEIDQVNFSMFTLDYEGKVTYNNRLRSTGARYAPYDDHIEVNPKMWRHGKGVVIGIIKHELCHFYIQHYGAEDAKPHGRQFKQLLYTVGGLRYAPRLKQKVTCRYFYQCQKCGLRTALKKPLVLKMHFYSCKKCGGSIAPIEHEPIVKYE